MEPTDLLGAWTLDRRVSDRRADVDGRVVGVTVLRAVDPDVVEWSESGEMVFAGRTTPVSRMLTVRRGPDGTWTVHFADGRVFHPWAWGSPVEHACAPDRYSGTLAGDAERWTVRWDAAGPAKDYRLDSVLTRRAP